MSDTVIAALVGASLAGILTLVVQLGVAVMARRHTEGHARAKGIAEFVSATHGAVVAIGLLAQQPLESKSSFRASAFYTSREDRETSALNVVQLLDPVDVVQAAAELHCALIRLEQDAQTREWTEVEWHSHRSTILGGYVTRVFTAGRKTLGRPDLERDRIWTKARATQALDSKDRASQEEGVGVSS